MLYASGFFVLVPPDQFVVFYLIMTTDSLGRLSIREYLNAYFELAKPRITVLLLIVAVIAYFIAAHGQWNWWSLAVVALSVGTLGTGIFALNHFMEREQDKLMARTERRPLPSGKLHPRSAFLFGMFFTLTGVVCSTLLGNLLTGIIAAAVAVSYLLVYTPLKYRTSLHTALGAFPGAAPPLAGWAIATGGLDANAWVLFGILFLWQFPHFLSIEMIYKEDYEKADVKVLPVTDKSGFSVAFQVVASLVGLLVLSLVPLWTGLSGPWFAIGAGVSGIAFLVVGIRAVVTKQKIHAKHLLRASVLYLPVVFLLLLIFR